MTSPPCLRLRTRRAAALVSLLGFATLACSCDGGSPAPRPEAAAKPEVPSKEPAKKGGKSSKVIQVPGGADYEDKPAARNRGR